MSAARVPLEGPLFSCPDITRKLPTSAAKLSSHARDGQQRVQSTAQLWVLELLLNPWGLPGPYAMTVSVSRGVLSGGVLTIGALEHLRSMLEAPGCWKPFLPV